MNKLAIALLIPALTAILVGCSSGSSEAPVPASVTNRYEGTFQSTNGFESGTIVLNLSETDSTVTGNVIFTSNGASCLRNATVEGTTTGFNFNLDAEQSRQIFTIETTITRTVVDADGSETEETESVTTRESSSGTEGTVERDLGGGRRSVTTTTSRTLSGTLNMQFNIGDNGNVLSGTYVSTGDTCSNGTGSGVMNLTRI